MESSQVPIDVAVDPSQQPVAAAPPPSIDWHALLSNPVRLLYVHNPFYAISAALVFAGLRASFDTSGTTFETDLLLGLLIAYTLLLASTALWIVRWGKVWDDARSLLLLVVISLLAISVTFDEALARNPRVGVLYYLGGWALTIVVSEALLHGLRMRLNAYYRLPYYLILSLFYFYPLLLVPLLSHPERASLAWGLFGFLPVMSVAFLALIPAIRRGAAGVRANGTPWPWPWFPWTLFGVLGFCAGVRAYYLCVSLHFVPGKQLIFSPWFLVPLLLALAMLLLEAAVVTRRKALEHFALALPVLLVGLALLPSQPHSLAAQFQQRFAEALGGSPAFWTFAALTAFYAYVALRCGSPASTALVGSLVAWSVVGPATHDLDSLASPQRWPLLAAVAVQAVVALRSRDARHWMALVAMLTIGLSLQFADSPLGQYGIFVPLNFALVLLLILAGLVDPDSKPWLYRAAAVLVVAIAWSALSRSPQLVGALPIWQTNVDPLAVSLLAIAYSQIIRQRALLTAGSIAGVSCLAVFGQRGYLAAREDIAGLDRISLGMTCFLIAAAISLWKARAARKS